MTAPTDSPRIVWLVGNWAAREVGMQDVRWRQRLDNFRRAFATLERVDAGIGDRAPSDVERLALVQGFEFTHELAWNLLRDYLLERGNPTIAGSKDATRLAFQVGLLTDGELWMGMIVDRYLTSHTYEAELADAVAERVRHQYVPALRVLRDRFAELASEREAT